MTTPWRDPIARNLLLFNLVATLVTAYTSETFFHPDEHFQVIEFLGLKLGFTEASELPWEYGERVRPFMQPALYYAMLKPLMALGLSDRFMMAFVLRLVSGLFAFGAMVALMGSSTSWVGHPDAQRSRLRWLTLAGFLPYLAVRTSSENLASSFLVLAVALLARDRPAEAAAIGRPLPVARALTVGLLLGMAFECRFQVAFSIVGLLAWVLWLARDLRAFCWIAIGCCVPVAAALLVDHWGYGVWTFPPWDYLRTNIFEGKAAEFGTKWFFAYLHITLANIFAPLVILAIVGLTLCWIRRPRHLLTWTTLPFVLGHSLVGHKEERFLFPILLLALVGAAMGYEQAEERASRRLERAAEACASAFRRLQRSWVYAALVVWNFVGLTLLAFYPLGWKPHEPFAHWAYRLPQPVHLVVDDPRLVPNYPFLREQPWQVHVLEPGQRADSIDSGGAALYLLREEPFTGFDADALGVSRELAYTEFPFAGSHWVRTTLWPKLGELRTNAVKGGYQAKRATWLSAYRVDTGSFERP
jgi:phosphatidylinositol glycan class B